MGGSNSNKGPTEDPYEKLLREIKMIEAAEVVIAVDFSQSNYHNSDGWGKNTFADFWRSGGSELQKKKLDDFEGNLHIP